MSRSVAGAILQRIVEVGGILVSIGFDKIRDRANLRVQGTVFKKG
jgi:hypothetical protein